MLLLPAYFRHAKGTPETVPIAFMHLHVARMQILAAHGSCRALEDV